MLGLLPKSLEVNGVSYSIDSDFRNILQIFAAFNDDELKDNEKTYICLRRLYTEFEKIPVSDYAEAYKAASDFIECYTRSDTPGPKVIDWEKDEQLIFAAVNKVAGTEIRAVPFMHWWTFLGYFQGIDRDDLWSFILTIRQKKAKHKKLEKYESEFFLANRALCEINHVDKKKDAEEYLLALYNNLKQQDSESDKEGGEG